MKNQIESNPAKPEHKTILLKRAAQMLKCEVDQWGNFTATANGIIVLCAPNKHSSIDRVIVCGIPEQTNAIKTFRRAKQIFAETGITTEFIFESLNKVFEP